MSCAPLPANRIVLDNFKMFDAIISAFSDGKYFFFNFSNDQNTNDSNLTTLMEGMPPIERT